MSNSKIRIVFIISSLYQGGAEKQFVQLIMNLNSTIFEKYLVIYAFKNEIFFDEVLKDADIKIITNVLKSKWSLLKICEACRFLYRTLKNTGFDLVISTLFLNNLLVRISSPLTYKNRIITNMRTSVDAYGYMYKLAERLLISKSFIVFNSNRSLAGFRKFIPIAYHQRMSLIYNGFIIPDQQNDSVSFTFGCLGRFSKEKNFLQVLSVFKRFSILYPNSNLLMQGKKGNQYDEISVALNNRDNIIASEPDSDIDKFFGKIKILIISSLYEGCPNVLFEGLLRRKMCIISKEANSDDYILNGRNGVVYDGTDFGLMEAMVYCARIVGSKKWDEITEEGFSYARENFSLHSMIRKYEQLFLAVHENKSGY